MALPQGYQTKLGERGSGLSQGQRQLLSFARTLLADTPVLILDEATSNIDTRTEALIQDALQRLSATLGGLELDGHVDWGKFGPDFTPLQTGSTTAYVGGASYTIGPIIFGGSYYGFDSGYTRATPGAGSLHGYGLAAGGTYTRAPGASGFLEYLYGHPHTNGLDLVNGGASTANNNTRSQAFGLGTAFKW